MAYDRTYETTEHVEHFTLDSAGYAPQGVTYDQAGNLTYDGTYAYHYDAWNRLVTVAKAFRESTPDGNGGVTLGSVQEGSTVHLSSYDGLNRRIEKQVQNSADLDCTYHYYYDVNWRILETRNGSDETLQQMTWAPLNSPGGGGGYTDELVQIATNANTLDDPMMNWSPQTCFVCQDANYNILGIVNVSGDVIERYEYTPYGQRTVFTIAGSSDPDCYAPTLISKRIVTPDAPDVPQPYGLCPFGHQGLLHEEELASGAVIQNRRRILLADYGRWAQRDAKTYVDGASLYQYIKSNSLTLHDWRGLQTNPTTSSCDYCGPDVTGFFTDLVNYTFRWRSQQGGVSRAEGTLWLRNFGNNLDWLSTIGPYHTPKCPSAKCKNTYMLCGECVHDHMIGNMMYALLSRLFRIPDWASDSGGNMVQTPNGASDPPWDTNGYKLGRSVYDSAFQNKTLCSVLKSNMSVWQAANNTAAVPYDSISSSGFPNSELGTYWVAPAPIWPQPHASGYSECKECPESLKPSVQNTLPGGKFGTSYPPIPSFP